jgi:hypothetical protein
MSMSREARIENMEKALSLMFEDIGDRFFAHVYIRIDDSRYASIKATTWKELADRYLIRNIGHGNVIFTGYGWRTSLMSLKLHESAGFQSKLGRLSAALKDSVKGREHTVVLGSQSVADETGLGWDFVQNALHGELFQHVFGIVGAKISDDTVVIEVPIDFGNRPL